MRVRRAGPADAGAIAAVHVRSWQVGYRGLMPDHVLDGLSAAEREPQWRDRLAAGSVVFAAERDGELIGFCALSEPSRDEDAGEAVAEIASIYVDPGAWRAGAGRALMDAALGHLRAGEWQETTLWVLRENQAALHFYAALGFRADGAEQLYERTRTVGIRLRRSLAPADSL
ncbi:MAG TPA: GNAT family N-acetyltransferase [Solirubrobacteraceae bacterium]|nr:GNAT family N-acetyltransferase [Solirubrobacteraceae bacterium]